MKVYASTVINAPVADVWCIMRDFVGLTAWSPSVTGAHITNNKAADQVGAIRHLDISDGSVFLETLVELSDNATYFKYDIVEGPLPVTNYVATMRLQPVTEGDKTFASWSAEFETPDQHREDMTHVVGTLICAGGLAGLKAYCEDK